MGSAGNIVVNVVAQLSLKVPSAAEQNPVQAFGLYGQNPAFRVRVRPR